MRRDFIDRLMLLFRRQRHEFIAHLNPLSLYFNDRHVTQPDSTLSRPESSPPGRCLVVSGSEAAATSASPSSFLMPFPQPRVLMIRPPEPACSPACSRPAG